MRTFRLTALAASLLLFCNACYRVGSLMHPQFKTVAVAPVQNETVEYDLAAQVRGLLCERFMVDGSLKLVDEKEADCIVYARVTDVRFSEVSWAKDSKDGEDIFLPNEWSVTMTLEYSVVIPGRAQPLVKARKVTGTADFETGPDQMIGRLNGIRQAAYDASKNLISSFAEGW